MCKKSYGVHKNKEFLSSGIQKQKKIIDCKIKNHISKVELSSELVNELSKKLDDNVDFVIPSDVMEELIFCLMSKKDLKLPENIANKAIYSYVEYIKELKGFNSEEEKQKIEKKPEEIKPNINVENMQNIKINFADRYKKIALIAKEKSKQKKEKIEQYNKEVDDIANILRKDKEYSRVLKYDHTISGIAPEIVGLKRILKEKKHINLNTKQQLLLTEIYRYHKHGRKYFVSNEELCIRLDTCERNVRKTIQKLRNCGIIERELKRGRFFRKKIEQKLQEGNEKAEFYLKRILTIGKDYLNLIEKMQKANDKIWRDFKRNKRKKVPDNINKGIYNNIIYKYQDNNYNNNDNLIYRKDIKNIFESLNVPTFVQELIATRLSKIFYIGNKKFKFKNIFSQNPNYLVNLVSKLKNYSHGYIPELVEKIFERYDDCSSSYTFFPLREDQYYSYYSENNIDSNKIEELRKMYRYHYIKKDKKIKKNITNTYSKEEKEKEKEKEKVALKRKRKYDVECGRQERSYDIHQYLNDCDQYLKSWYENNISNNYKQNPQKPLQNAPECDFEGEMVNLYPEGEKDAKTPVKIDFVNSKEINCKIAEKVAINKSDVIEYTEIGDLGDEDSMKITQYKFDNIDSKIMKFEYERDTLLDDAKRLSKGAGGGGTPNDSNTSSVEIESKLDILEKKIHNLYRVRKRLEDTIGRMQDGILKDSLFKFCIRGNYITCISEMLKVPKSKITYTLQKFFKGFENGIK